MFHVLNQFFFFHFQTEAPILIRPYLSIMTKSELHAVMVGGFATIAGGVLAAYIKFGVSWLSSCITTQYCFGKPSTQHNDYVSSIFK